MPIVPLALLILSSKQVAVIPEMSVATSMVLGVLITFIVTMSDIQTITTKFFDGMGSAYANVIGLIICATVFTSGLAAMGLVSTLIEMMDGSQSLAALSGTFGPFLIALISGSGDAAAFAFNGAVTPYAEQFGMSIVGLGSLAQIAGAIGRAVSPVAGAAIICAGLARVNPIEVSKRSCCDCVNAFPELRGFCMIGTVPAVPIIFCFGWNKRCNGLCIRLTKKEYWRNSSSWYRCLARP